MKVCLSPEEVNYPKFARHNQKRREIEYRRITESPSH